MAMRMAMATSVALSTSLSVAQATSPVVQAIATPVAGAAMSMSMGGGDGCKLSMLLNWHTIDACFLSSIFHIRSSFTFFLACLGAFALVISLEFIRRFQREFDRYLRKRNKYLRDKEYGPPAEMEEKLLDQPTEIRADDGTKPKAIVVVLQQFSRGLIHVGQFSISYCVMLLFMYSNGSYLSISFNVLLRGPASNRRFIIISILVGALVGFALFTQDTLYYPRDTNENVEVENSCC
ncbi:high affinity copper transporter [Diplocarpon rosae]|nr:high affinity copper transporter [Diplocarpon rosae]